MRKLVIACIVAAVLAAFGTAMASGIFPDIEKALSAPGTEIDKSMGKYIVHNDYAVRSDRSRRENATEIRVYCRRDAHSI
jgi:hypothetical protein